MKAENSLSPRNLPQLRAKTAPRRLWAWAVATFFGVGYLKPGPGTYGSIAAVLFGPRLECSATRSARAADRLLSDRARASPWCSRSHHRRARIRPPRSRLRRHR